MIDLQSFVLQNGPWAALSFYLIIRFEKTIKTNTKAVEALIMEVKNGRKRK